MSERPVIIQRPQSFKEWYKERYPDHTHRDHASMVEVWFTGAIGDTSLESVERLANAVSEYLDERFTERLR